MTGITFYVNIAPCISNIPSDKISKSWKFMILDITMILDIKAREGEMSDVPLRNTENNIQYQYIRNRLEKLKRFTYVYKECL